MRGCADFNLVSGAAVKSKVLPVLVFVSWAFGILLLTAAFIFALDWSLGW